MHNGRITDEGLKKRRAAKAAARNRRQAQGFAINALGHRKSCKDFGQCINHHH